MANIISLDSRRKKPLSNRPSDQDLYLFWSEDIFAHWEKAAKLNRLNEFFISCTSLYTDPLKNYVDDLSAISKVEQNIGLSPQVLSPGYSEVSSTGWVCAFRLGYDIYATPPLPSEAFSRCFNILLFLKLKREFAVQM